jgi:hypothetical protein
MELALALLAIGAAAGAIIALFRRKPSGLGKSEGRGGASRSPADARRDPLPGHCPLCGYPLAAGERVKTAVFPGGQGRLAHVFGCVRCLAPADAAKRFCPVCGDELRGDGYVIGRYFEKPGRSHLHVLGCTSCRRG